jgi:streptothricin acetyltransferase
MFFSRTTENRVVPLTLDQLRALPPIASGYDTTRVFRLTKRETDAGISWDLTEHENPLPVHKVYDDGESATWLKTYADAGPPESLRFLGAERGSRIEALATWTVTDWNASLWLVDIRVRARCRGQGLGSALIDELVARCREASLRGIFVETQIQNYPAISFYRRHGFTVTGFNDHLYTNQDLVEQDVALFLFKEV